MIKKGTTSIDGIFKGSTEIAEIRKGTDLVYENFKTLTSEGVPPLTLSKCKNINMLGYKVYGQSKQQILPDGYTQLEYIESTGTQYIDTEYNANQNIEVRVKASNDGTASMTSIVGVLETNTNSSLSLFLPSSVGTTAIARFDGKSITMTGFLDGEFIINKNGLYRNGVLYNSFGEINNFTSTDTMYLFKVRNNTQYLDGKIYYCKIYDNGVLVRNLIPAKNSSNVIGMYDTVNDVFYTNQGTGTFVAGPNAPTPEAPIEIESVGDKTANLWETNGTNYGWITTTGALSTSQGVSRRILVEQNKTYYYTSYRESGGFYNCIAEYDANMNFITGTRKIITTGSKKQNSVTITNPNTKYLICAYYTINYNVPEWNMITQGNNTMDFIPYGYKIPVKKASSNLLPYPYNISSGKYSGVNITINNDGSFTLDGTSTGLNATLKTFRLKAGTYTISGNPDANLRLWLRVVGSMSSAYYTSSYGGRKGTLTINQDSDMYVYITLNNGVSIDNVTVKPMLNKGSSALSFEPYVEPRTTNIYLDEPLRKIENYADYIDFETQKVIRNIGEFKVQDLTWYSRSMSNNRFEYYTNGLIDKVLKPNNGNDTINIVTTMGCVPTYQSATWGENNICVRNSATDPNQSKGTVSIISLIYTTLNDFLNTYNNMKAIYPLETPIEESIELPDILLNKGTNVIDVETSIIPSNMWVKYKGK